MGISLVEAVSMQGIRSFSQSLISDRRKKVLRVRDLSFGSFHLGWLGTSRGRFSVKIVFGRFHRRLQLIDQNHATGRDAVRTAGCRDKISRDPNCFFGHGFLNIAALRRLRLGSVFNLQSFGRICLTRRTRYRNYR